MTAEKFQVILAQLYSNLQPPNADPLSIEVLAGALERYCPDCQVEMLLVNPLNPPALENLIRTVTQSDCRVLGVSVPQGTYELALQLLEALDNGFSETMRPVVVLGHALPTHVPEAFLRPFPWAVAAKGWGEDALVTLVQMAQQGDIHLDQVPGIAYVDNNRVKYTRIKSKSEIIPQPPKRLQAKLFFPRIETSRGCHYGLCSFCTRPPGRVNSWTRLPLKPLLHSITELKNQGISYFTFTDEDFIGHDLKGALAIARGIAKIGGVTFSISIRADNIYNPKGSKAENAKRKKVLEALKQAGLTLAFIGVESLSDTQLERYRKGICAQDSVRATNIVKDLGIEFEMGFILFDPFVTVEELNQTAEILRDEGLWEHVGYLFSELRVQKATYYETTMRHQGLLGDFDINILSYKWKFHDHRVAEMASACLLWAGTSEPLYKAARNIERTDQDHRAVKQFITEFRRLDVRVFDHLLIQLDNSSPGQALEIGTYFYEQRRILVEGLGRSFQPSTTNNVERLLIDTINRFLTAQD